MAWYLTDGSLVFGYRKSRAQLLPKTKRGLPSGAMVYDTEAAALLELRNMQALGEWFLWTPRAKAERV